MSSCDLRSNEMPDNKISPIRNQIEQITAIKYQKKHQSSAQRMK
jgi:hypothetical protein